MRVAETVPADGENDLAALLRRFELPLLQYATRILRDHDGFSLVDCGAAAQRAVCGLGGIRGAQSRSFSERITRNALRA